MSAFLKYSLVALFLFSLASCSGSRAVMTNERLSEVIHEVGTDVQEQGNVAQFAYEGVLMLCVFDLQSDRMRLVAPIAEEGDVTDIQRKIMLEANYHSALDARYATSDGVLYGVFIHPLSTLDETLLRSAIRQVGSVVRTFGSTYSSGELFFGGPAEE